MIETLKIIISAEINKVKEALGEGKQEVKSFSKQVEEASKDVDKDFAKAGESIKSGLKTAAIGIAAAGAALLALGASSAEYRNEQAKLKTAFEAAGASAETAKGTYNDLFRVLGDSGKATEAAGHLAKLTTEQKALSEWTTICQGVYATFGDSLPIESLTEAANETAKTGQLTGALADALNWAGVNEDDFQAKLEACNNEAERERLIRETLNGLYTEAANKYEENNAQVIAQNESQIKLNDAMAKLGEVTAPIITMLTELAAEVLTALAPFLESFANNLLPIIKDVLGGVAAVLGEIIGFLAEHQILLGVLATAIGIIVTAIGLYNTVMAVKKAMDVAEVATVWQLVAAYYAKAVAMGVALAPYILIVAAIAAVIAIIVVCIKYWDEIVAAVKNCVEAIYKALGNVANWIYNNMIKPIADFFAGLWKSITGIFADIGKWFANIFSQAANGVKNAFSGIVNFFTGIFNSIKSVFTKIGDVIGGAISKTVGKAVNAVLSTAVGIINGFISAINLAISAINLIPGVNLSKLSKLSVPKMAKGGIVDSATLAVVGEQGKEAVVPLENNLGWLDKLATMLNERMGGNTPIVMQVDGKTFAEVSISSINSLTEQTGRLPLIIV